MPSRSRPLHPSVLLIGSFGALIAAGAALLTLPAAAQGEPIGLLDALFTSTSAVCVTGLAVVDTGSRLSGFGQAVVLGLIQFGGLGIMTFAVLFMLVLGRRVSLPGRTAMQDAFHHSGGAELRRLLGHVVAFTLSVEAVGAATLWLRFRPDHPAADAAWLAAFHAVSAFCNAGFSLFPDSLVRYRGDLTVNLVVGLLIVAGGIGFLVHMELQDRVRRPREGRRPVSLHTRVVLGATGALLGLGFLAFLALEWSNLLAGLPLHEKLLAAAFQSVTPRTAGFNTVDYGRATSLTLFATILLMFVGASPGSTGGGIKTTTLAVLLALSRARWAGRERAELFRRSVPVPVLDRALSLTLVSWLVASGALALLLATEHGLAPHTGAEPRFLALMFEAVSAFATVGLSTGITPGLSDAGKLVLIALMFVGRVGPLTVALAAGRRRRPGEFRYAEENVMIG